MGDVDGLNVGANVGANVVCDVVTVVVTVVVGVVIWHCGNQPSMNDAIPRFNVSAVSSQLDDAVDGSSMNSPSTQVSSPFDAGGPPNSPISLFSAATVVSQPPSSPRSFFHLSTELAPVG